MNTARKAIREGRLRGAALVDFLAAFPPGDRDRIVEELLGIAHRRLEAAPLGGGLVGYIPSGVGPIVRALMDVPVGPSDVLVDVGAGLGKVVMLAELLAGARGHGIELQPHLVEEARACASALGLTRCTYHAADARHAHLAEGTVFFMYLPFTGEVMEEALNNLHRAAQQRAIVVCALGFDLTREWLKPRTAYSFWLTLYDSVVPGVPARVSGPGVDLGPAAERVAEELP